MADEKKASDIHDICLGKKAISCYRKMGEETCSKCKTYQMYKLGFAEGRKEGYELARKRAYERQQDLTDTYIRDGETIRKQGEEIAELKETFDELKEENEQLKADLKEAWMHCKAVDDVNEKMKCCGNCKHIRYDYEYSFCELNKNGSYPCVNRDKWEMKE